MSAWAEQSTVCFSFALRGLRAPENRSSGLLRRLAFRAAGRAGDLEQRALYGRVLLGGKPHGTAEMRREVHMQPPVLHVRLRVIARSVRRHAAHYQRLHVARQLLHRAAEVVAQLSAIRAAAPARQRHQRENPRQPSLCIIARRHSVTRKTQRES